MSDQQVHVDTEKGKLKKYSMSTLSVFLLIYCLVAGGYFGLEDMVSSTGPGLTLLILVVFPIFWSIPQALYACELGSAIPDEGGYYVWVKRAFGEFWGFQVGWWRTISCYVDSALYVVITVGYISTYVKMTGWQEFVLKAAIILFFTWVNYRGIKDVGKITSVLMIFVLATLVVFIVLGVINWKYNPVLPFVPEGQTVFGSLGIGIAIAIWLYSGYESMGTMAGELENPHTITKGTLLSIPAVILLYTLPVLFGLASYGDYSSWATEGGTSFVTIVLSYGIPGLGLIFILGAIACNLSLYNSYLASSSRGFYCIAEDKLAPPMLCKVNKKHGTPHIAIFSMSIINLLFVQFGFETLVVIDVILFMFAYLIWFLSGIALRINEPDLPRPFKIPGGVPFLVLITIVPIIICVTAFFTNGISYLIGGSLGLLTGPVAYYIFKKRYGGINQEKSLSGSQKKSCGLLIVIIVACIATGFGMYQKESHKASTSFAAIEKDLSRNYEVGKKKFIISEDSFYLTLGDRQHDAAEAGVWYYQGGVTGDVNFGNTAKDEQEFSEMAYETYTWFCGTDGTLLVDYIDIYSDDFSITIYPEDAYGSASSVYDALTSE